MSLIWHTGGSNAQPVQCRFRPQTVDAALAALVRFEEGYAASNLLFLSVFFFFFFLFSSDEVTGQTPERIATKFSQMIRYIQESRTSSFQLFLCATFKNTGSDVYLPITSTVFQPIPKILFAFNSWRKTKIIPVNTFRSGFRNKKVIVI